MLMKFKSKMEGVLLAESTTARLVIDNKISAAFQPLNDTVN